MGHKKDLGDRTQLKSRIFYNDYETTYLHTQGEYDDTFKMRGFGAETVAYYNEENYNLTGGLYFEGNFLDFLSGFNGGLAEQFEGAKNTFDRQAAVFGDWVYTGISKWQFNLGGRLLFSDGVLNGVLNLMPRVGIVYEIKDNWTAKYLFNSSVVQPTLTTKTGGADGTTSFRNGADDPQKFNVHDLQLRFENETTSLTTTLFYIEVKDMILFVSSGGKRFDNAADATSKGVQIEFTHKLPKVKTYGDYTFALATFDDRNITSDSGAVIDIVRNRTLANESLRMAGTPMHQWNIGVDLNLKQNFTLNLHHRGYAEIFTKWQRSTDYRTLPAGIFFDTSLHWQNAVKGLNTTFYIKNLADSDAVTPM